MIKLLIWICILTVFHFAHAASTKAAANSAAANAAASSAKNAATKIVKEYSFAYDYNLNIGSKKASFLQECSSTITPVVCKDVKPSGSLTVLSVEGLQAGLDGLTKTIQTSGLVLPSFKLGKLNQNSAAAASNTNSAKPQGTKAPAGTKQNFPESPLISTEAPILDAFSTTNAETTAEPIVTHPAVNIKKWGYPAINSKWGALCESGDTQSPIDLPELTEAQPQYPLVEYMQYRQVSMIGVDSGVGLKWNPKKGEPELGYLTMDKAKFSMMYWTIHTGSEHTSNGKQFDMELQFYHKSQFGRMVVLSVLCSVMPLRKASTFWNQIRDAMSEPTEVNPMLLLRDMELDTSRWFEYEGSLTTPPCDQGITWIVLAEQCAVPHDFYKYATSFDSMQENFRPPQPIKKRKIKAKSGVFSGNWHYPARNDEWGGTCLTGKEQSPIDFNLEIMTSMQAQKPLLGDITGGKKQFFGHDTGKSLKFTPKSKGSGINYKGTFWELEQFHLHTKSEHTIAGGQYDMEIVFVHKSKSGKLLNIGVLCKAEDFGQNAFFDGLRHSMTGQGKQEGFEADYKVDVMQSLGDDTQYMRYRGSITVPPCNEGVEWIVMAALLQVPTDFLIWLKQFKSMKYNFRPPQPLNGRVVLTSKDSAVGSGLESYGFFFTVAQLALGSGLVIFGLIFLLDCQVSWKVPRSDETPLLGGA